jgi:hypothetical protein
MSSNSTNIQQVTDKQAACFQKQKIVHIKTENSFLRFIQHNAIKALGDHR